MSDKLKPHPPAPRATAVQPTKPAAATVKYKGLSEVDAIVLRYTQLINSQVAKLPDDLKSELPTVPETPRLSHKNSARVGSGTTPIQGRRQSLVRLRGGTYLHRTLIAPTDVASEATAEPEMAQPSSSVALAPIADSIVHDHSAEDVVKSDSSDSDFDQNMEGLHGSDLDFINSLSLPRYRPRFNKKLPQVGDNSSALKDIGVASPRTHFIEHRFPGDLAERGEVQGARATFPRNNHLGMRLKPEDPSGLQVIAAGYGTKTQMHHSTMGHNSANEVGHVDDFDLGDLPLDSDAQDRALEVFDRVSR